MTHGRSPGHDDGAISDEGGPGTAEDVRSRPADGDGRAMGAPRPHDRRPRSPIRQLPWARLIAEFLAIVTGVLFALAVNEWWEGREDDARATAALADFRREITRNRQVLDSRIEYHRDVLLPALDSLVAIAASGGRFDPLTGGPFPRGTYLRPLFDTAWETAIATEAFPLLELDVASTIAAAYSGQEVLAALDRRATESLLVPSTFEPQNFHSAVVFMRILFDDMVSTEAAVARLYERAQRTIDEALGAEGSAHAGAEERATAVSGGGGAGEVGSEAGAGAGAEMPR